MGNATAAAPLGRKTAGSHFVDPGAGEWQETDAPGFLVKPIFQDGTTGASTMLMKIAPGAYAPPHAHAQLEEIYVLEGTFADEEHSYGPGQYCLRAVGAMHTAASKDGCVVLLIYRP